MSRAPVWADHRRRIENRPDDRDALRPGNGDAGVRDLPHLIGADTGTLLDDDRRPPGLRREYRDPACAREDDFGQPGQTAHALNRHLRWPPARREKRSQEDLIPPGIQAICGAAAPVRVAGPADGPAFAGNPPLLGNVGCVADPIDQS